MSIFKGSKRFAIIFGSIALASTVSLGTLMGLCAADVTYLSKDFCEVRFHGSDTFSVLEKVKVRQGETAEFTKELPKKAPLNGKQFIFVSWLPMPTNVVHDLDCYPFFADTNDLDKLADLADKVMNDNDFQDHLLDQLEDLAKQPFLTVTTKLPGKIYLRSLSYGDYMPESETLFTKAPGYKVNGNKPETNPLNYTSMLAKDIYGTKKMEILYNSKFESIRSFLKNDINFEIPVPQYLVPKSTDKNVLYNNNDIYNVRKIKNNRLVIQALNMSYSTKDIYNLKEASKELPIEELKMRQAYYNDKADYYTFLNASTKSYIRQYCNRNKINIKSPNVIINMVESLNKNATLGRNIEQAAGSNFIYQFFNGEHITLVPYQAATISTLLLRYANIPTRVCLGFCFDNGNGNMGPKEVKVNELHYWNEVFIENVGWLTVDPYGEIPEPEEESDNDTDIGELEPAKTEITFDFSDYAKEYDNLPNTQQTLSNFVSYNGQLKPNHRVVISSQTNFEDFKRPGKYQLRLQADIVDEYNTNVNDEYIISNNVGNVFYTINHRKISFITSKIGPISLADYNGLIDLNSFNNYETVETIGLLRDHSVSYEFYTIDSPGEYENTIKKFRIYDSLGNDVTNNYIFDQQNSVFGEVTVTP